MSGSCAWRALHRLAAREAEARVGEHGDGARRRRVAASSRERAREEVVAGRARGAGPNDDHADARPRRHAAPSMRSSCTRVAMWTSSTATPAATAAPARRRT